MTEKKKQVATETLELVRDGICCTAVLSIAIGTGLEYGFGFGLIAFGATMIGLFIFGQVRK
jgi:hypothetical protein